MHTEQPGSHQPPHDDSQPAHDSPQQPTDGLECPVDPSHDPEDPEDPDHERIHPTDLLPTPPESNVTSPTEEVVTETIATTPTAGNRTLVDIQQGFKVRLWKWLYTVISLYNKWKISIVNTKSHNPSLI